MDEFELIDVELRDKKVEQEVEEELKQIEREFIGK